MVLGMGGGGNSLEVEVQSTGVGEFNSRMDDAVGSLNSFKGAATKAGSALAGIGAAGAIGVGKAVSQAGKLEKSFAEVSTLMGENVSAQEEFGDAVRRLSSDFAAQGGEVEVVNGLYSTLSAGITESKDATQLMETAMKSASAGLTDTQTSVDALTTVVNAYGMQADEAEGVSDVLFETVRQGKTTFPELAKGIGQVIPTAAEMGVKVEEIGAATATLTANGQSTDQAMTAINQTLTQLLKPTEAASGLISKLGYESGRAMVESEGLQGSLNLLKGAAEDNSVEMAEVFNNVQAMRAAFPLAGQAAGDFDENLKAMESSAGATNQAYEKMADTTQHRVQSSINEAKGAVNDFGMALIGQLTPYLETASGALSKAADAFTQLDDRTKKAVAQVTLLGTAVSGAAGLLLLGVPAASALAGALGTLTAPLMAIPGLIAGAVTAVASFTSAAVALGTTLYGTFMGAITLATGALTALPGVIAAAGSALLGLPAAAATAATAFASTLATAATSAVASIAALPGAIASAIAAKIAAAAQSFTLAGAYGVMQSAALTAAAGTKVLTASLLTLSAPIAAIAIAAAGLYLAYKKNFLGIKNITDTVIAAVRAALNGNFMQSVAIVRKGAKSAYTSFRNNIQPIANVALKTFNKVRSVVSTVLNYLYNSVVRPIAQGISRIWSKHNEQIVGETNAAMTNIWSTIQPALQKVKGMFMWFYGVATGIWNRFGDEIMTIVDFAMASIVGYVLTAVDGAITGFRVLLAFLSGDWTKAWNLASGFVKDTLSGIVTYVQNWGPRVIGAVWGILTGIIGKFRDMAREIIGNSIVPDMFQAIGSYIAGAGNRLVGNAVDGVARTVRGGFNKAKDWALGSISDLFSSAQTAFSNGVSGLKSTFNDAIPSSIEIPSVEIGGQSLSIPEYDVPHLDKTVGGGGLSVPEETVGGGSLGLPQLDTGGFIEGDGLAMLHAGEEVVPKAEVDRNRDEGGDGDEYHVEVYANSKRGGKDAGKAFTKELRSLNS